MGFAPYLLKRHLFNKNFEKIHFKNIVVKNSRYNFSRSINYHGLATKKFVSGADAIKKFTPGIGIPYLGV